MKMKTRTMKTRKEMTRTQITEMREQSQYGRGERLVLWTVAVAGLVGMNGAFLYGMTQPDVVRQTLENPLALAFVVEAFVLMGVLAWLLTKWGVARLRWPWFVALSLLGSMAFALPVVLLWSGSRTEEGGALEARR